MTDDRIHWFLTSKDVRVCSVLTDAEFQAIPNVVLAKLVRDGVVVKRLVRVPLAEFGRVVEDAAG